jgi:prephenate dehydratase
VVAALSERESTLKIAIQGEPGSFSHEAALKFVPGAEILPCSLSVEVFAALDNRKADAAAIPIENSLAGSVLEHFDLLLAHDVKVVRETPLRIRHNLIALDGVSIGEIDRVYSHPVALAQCRRFLAAHPAMRATAFYDTAGSVKHIKEQNDRRAAAIASEAAARIYGAQVLDGGIEDNPENYTRFFLVRRSGDAQNLPESPDPEANKLSLAFSLENRPGSLVAALSALAAQGTNLTKIESRPVQGKPWEYIFYVDCQIGAGGEALRAGAGGEASSVLEALRPHCGMVKELGRYREARSAANANS